MSTSTAQRNHLIGALQVQGNDVPILGNVVWWNVREVNCTRDFFKLQLDAVGIDGEKYAREHNYRATLIRCLRSLTEQRLIEKVKEDMCELTYQFTRRELVDQGDGDELQYEKELTFTIDKTAYFDCGDIEDSISKCDDSDVRAHIISLFNEEKVKYNSSDVTRYVQKILNDHSDIVSLRPQGAVYFVPASGQELVQKLAQVLDNIQGQGYGIASLSYFPVPNVESAANMVGQGVDSEITDLFGKMDEEITKMQTGSGEITEKWIQTRKDRIQKVKDRLKMYQNVLGDRADELSGDFDALAATLKPRALDI